MHSLLLFPVYLELIKIMYILTFWTNYQHNKNVQKLEHYFGFGSS